LEALIKRQKLPTRLRKIDLSDKARAGPVAQQYGIRGIPALRFYDGTKPQTSEPREVFALLSKGAGH